MSSEQQSGVIYGEPRDVIALAERLKKQQFSSSGHEGVLLDRSFVIDDGCYREDHQFFRVKILGRGSFGTVLVIRDTTSKKDAVGKYVLLAKFAPNEAVLWCQLIHPYIVRFLGLVRTDSEVMFLSEYNPNYQTLQSLVDRRVIGQGQALALTKPLFQALEYLHENSIVHKDINPNNILVNVQHLDFRHDHSVRVIDFGLSVKLSSPTHTDDGTPRGHYAYMAPEIARGDTYDARADVWSAVCTLMCLLKGCAPWSQNTGQGFILVDIPPATDWRLRQLIEWALKERLNERPTASQVLERWPGDIEKELYSNPGVTGPPMDNYSPPELADSAQSGQQSDDSMDVNVGDPQVGSDSVDPQVGSDSVDPQVGSDSVNPQVGSDSVDLQVGSDSVDLQVGSDSVDPQVASDSVDPQVASDSVDPQVASDSVDPQVASDSVDSQPVEEDLASCLADLKLDDTGDRDARPPVVKGIFVNIHDGSRSCSHEDSALFHCSYCGPSTL